MDQLPKSIVTQRKFRNILIITSLFTENPRGGSDRHTLELVRILRKVSDITVLTSTAVDYQTWKSVLKPGVHEMENTKVIRFVPQRERKIQSFNRFLTKFYKRKFKKDLDYKEFVNEQGPVVPELVRYLESNSNHFDLVLFIGYLYYPIIYSIPLVKSKSILIPTLHDEPPAYFPIYKKTFTDDLGYAFNTPEELEIFENIYKFTPSNFEIIGVCTTIPSISSKPGIVEPPYIVYIGRVDQGKGIFTLIEYFIEWRNSIGSKLKLVIIGMGDIRLEEGIIHLSEITEEEKIHLLRHAYFLVNPSPLESFSIVLMEAWLLGVPVLVNGSSKVLKNHCIRSNAGLYYSDKESFFASMNYLSKNPVMCEKMGKNGKIYVEENYSEDRILEKFYRLYSNFLDSSEKN